MNKPSRSQGRELTIALLVLLIAAGCATAATMAWFSIADYARIRSMSVEITTGAAIMHAISALIGRISMIFTGFASIFSWASVSSAISAAWASLAAA